MENNPGPRREPCILKLLHFICPLLLFPFYMLGYPVYALLVKWEKQLSAKNNDKMNFRVQRIFQCLTVIILFFATLGGGLLLGLFISHGRSKRQGPFKGATSDKILLKKGVLNVLGGTFIYFFWFHRRTPIVSY